MDIPLEHKKDTHLAVHLHEYDYGMVVDIRHWRILKDGTKKMGKGIRISLEHGMQLAQRLERLYKRHQETKDVVVDRTSKASWGEAE